MNFAISLAVTNPCTMAKIVATIKLNKEGAPVLAVAGCFEITWKKTLITGVTMKINAKLMTSEVPKN